MSKTIDKVIAVGGALGSLVTLWDRFQAWRAERAERKLRADYERLVAKSRAKAEAAGKAAAAAARARAKANLPAKAPLLIPPQSRGKK